MIKVSIIIPVYNVKRYLIECLESVINQTLKDIEVICVNDFSTDDSAEILNKYAAKDGRITIINNNKNYGQSYSRNRGLELSQGEYVYFLDSDDMITLEAMEELYDAAKNQNLDAVLFDSKVIFENEQLKKRFSGYEAERKNKYLDISKGQDIFAQLIHNKDWTASPPRQFWRRNYLIENNLKFYEGIIHEDELFSFLALLKSKHVLCTNKRYFIRRLRENSTITSTISIKNFEGTFICYCEMLAFWKSMNFDDYINNAIDSYISRLYKITKSHYRRICDKLEINELEHGNTFANHLYRSFVSSSYEDRICKHIEKQKLETIRQYNTVIIYGAGVVARDVLEILDRNEIGIQAFAVTDKIGNPQFIMGNSVCSIDELIEYRNDAIVLVSVISKHQKSILEKLEELEFKNVMLML